MSKYAIKKDEYVEMGYKYEDDTATQDLEMHFIEIPKFLKKFPKPKNKLEQWLYLIAGKEEMLKDIEGKVKEIEKAVDTLEELSADKEAWNLYEARERAMRDYNSGMRYAKEQGWNEGQKARNKNRNKNRNKKAVRKPIKKKLQKNYLRKICPFQKLLK